jgi:glucose/mannose-6-phosphate isomerase
MHRFLDEYRSWYELSKKALTYGVTGNIKERRYDGIAVAGMGGSGIIGDIIYSIAYDSLRVPVTIIKDFDIPQWISENWLFVAISYSGNTVETLSAVRRAEKIGCSIAAVASGGKLIDLAKSRGYPYVLVDKGRVPRSSLPALLIAAIKLLKAHGFRIIWDLRTSIEFIRDKDIIEEEANELADFLYGSLPVFISTWRYYSIALRGKNEFNENAKMAAKVEIVPEWGHNDIVGWEGKEEYLKAVVLYDKSSLIMKFVVDYLRDSGIGVRRIGLSGEDFLGDILRASMILGIASVKLGIRKGIDPRETKSIKKYKEFLSELRCF